MAAIFNIFNQHFAEVDFQFNPLLALSFEKKNLQIFKAPIGVKNVHRRTNQVSPLYTHFTHCLVTEVKVAEKIMTLGQLMS